jgi:uncharacterized protein (TIGR02265 family)
MESPSKKGLSFVATRDYVLQTHGNAAWESVLRAMDPLEAEVVHSAVGIGWYPLELYGKLLRIIDRQLGNGDLRAIPAMARFEAERDLPTIHRLLLKMVRPAYIVEKMSELWPRYNSTGHLAIHRRGDRAVDVTLSEWSTDEALCIAIEGYSARALELAGARGLRIAQTSCRARGAEVCFFRIMWGPLDG